MIHFVFCHGFGLNRYFWEPIAPYFSQKKCTFIDVGYFNTPVNPPFFSEDEKIIGVGHSMGLLKLISIYKSFDCLIGLNSFTDFLGSDKYLYEKRVKELKALKRNFLRHPEETLKKFYMRCGIPEFIHHAHFSHLNLDLLYADLEALQKQYILPNVPTFILQSHEDSVVPHQITLDNFLGKKNVKIDTILDSGHGLGFRKPLEVYKKMMDFVDDSCTR